MQRKFSLIRPVEAFALLLILSGCTVFMADGQGVTAAVRGTVHDQSGAVIRGAAVALKNVTKGWSRSVTANESGDYELLQLTPADTYEISGEAPGFKKQLRSGVVLQTGQETRVDFTLMPGDVTETVSVEENASLIQSEDASIGAVVDERKVKELPLNGRQFWQLAQLVPNVMPPAQNSTIGFRGGFNIAGSPETTNNYILDGIDNSDEATMQPTNRPSVDGIQEFRVLTGIYNAEYGRFSGGQVLVTTKSGTNEFHGTVYEFLRNSALDARNFFSPKNLPAFRRNQFGLSNGGAILKNRTFYFATYEGLRLSNAVEALASVPTGALGAGDLNGLPNASRIVNPLTGQPFPGNRIPQSQLSPTSQQLLSFWPAPTGGGLANNYRFNEVGTEEDNQFSGRIDQIISTKNTLFASYQFADRTTFYPSNTLCSSRVVPGFGCTEPERDQFISINDTHVFGPTLVNELRLGYNRIRTNRLNEDAKFGNVVQQLGIPQGGANGVQGPEGGNLGLPQVSISGFATLGGATNLPQGRRDNTYNIIDDMSWVHNGHTVKFGADFKHFIYNVDYWSLGRGGFTFNGQYTGNAFADFLLGDLRTTSRAPGDPAVRSFTTSNGFFVQDDWKVSSHLTLDFGLRYELFFPQGERTNTIATFDPSTGLVPVADGQLLNTNPQTGQLVNVGESTLRGNVWHLQKNNLAPRFGFAWRPLADNKTVIRGGYGIFYNLLADGNGVSQLFRGIPFRLNQTFTNSVASPAASWLNPFPSGRTAGGFAANGIAADFNTESVQQWSASVERELVPDLILEVTYLGSKGTHLPLSYNLNQPVPGPGAIQARRPYPQWSNVTWLDSVGASSYNSLSARLERRFTSGLSLIASYTYSHALDLGTAPSTGSDGSASVQDPRNIAAEWASSDIDVRSRFVGSFVYELPFGSGKALGSDVNRFVKAAISGWEVTGIATFQTGMPFTVTSSKDISNTGGSNRPLLVGDPHVSNADPTRWFNTAAFSINLPANTFAYGNVGRNTLRGAGTQNIDVGIFRNFHLAERFGLQFRAELFNTVNHTNFGLPANDVNSQSFGQVSQTSTPSREVQFGLKLTF